jgi:hypothetical protein
MFQTTGAWVAISVAVLAIAGPATADDPAPIMGRWDLTGRGAGEEYPSWLEVRLSGYRTLVGSFVGRFGSARPISRVEFDHGHVKFSIPPQWEGRKDDLVFEGKLEGDVLRGETTDDAGKKVEWEGRRAPSLKRAH